jgi:hypothetical protein
MLSYDVNKVKKELDENGYPHFQFDQNKNLQFAVQLMLENRETMNRIAKALSAKAADGKLQVDQRSVDALKSQYDIVAMIKIIESEGYAVTRKKGKWC